MRLPLVAQFDEQTADIIQTVDTITDQYTNTLDICVDEVKYLLRNKDDLTIEQLNYYIAYIPVLLYDLTDKIQNLGVKTDAARMERKQMFNSTYLELEHGTVSKKTSAAQQACQDEQMIEDVFTRVYKKCEDKVEMATMLHGSLKKILQWRVSELEVTRTNIITQNML